VARWRAPRAAGGAGLREAANPGPTSPSRAKQELLHRAAKMKIKGRSRMKKGELLEAIRGH
jgi:hypothetical protein